MCAAFVLLWFFFTGDTLQVPSFHKVRSSYAKSDAVLYDRHGIAIHELRVDFHGRSLEWTALNAISPTVQEAVIASEDKRFYSHCGIDYVALAHAVTQNIFSRERRGASTITMQVASQS